MVHGCEIVTLVWWPSVAMLVRVANKFPRRDQFAQCPTITLTPVYLPLKMTIESLARIHCH